MTTQAKPPRTHPPVSLPVIIGVIAVGWTLLLGVSLAWNLNHIQQTVRSLALVAARSSFEKDLLYRHWASLHGGVYVPVTEKNPPNPYLTNVVERDITTPSGRKLTLMNPAYMTRQVHELSRELYRYQGHITSLNPIRPENAADGWERTALLAFARGTQEVSTVTRIDGQSYLRFMRPMVTSKSCLNCHAQQGYREGDIRGGIAVTVPLADYEVIVRPHQRNESLMHAMLWLLGLLAMGIGAHQMQHRRRERDLSQAALRESEQALQASQRVAQIGHYSFTPATGQWTSSEVLDTIFGIGPEYQRDVAGWEQLIHPDDRGMMQAHLRTVIETKVPFNKEYRIVRNCDRQERWVQGLGNLELDQTNRVVCMFGTIQDISERKQLEEQLRQSQKMEAVGQLAGGVAHDYNNLLASTMINLELLGEEPNLSPNAQTCVQDLARDSERAASLTRQLLLFSRRQVMQVKALDVNVVLDNLIKMLRRLLGEHIEIRFLDSRSPLWVEADPGMMEQAVINMCVNARDAMPNGGHLTLVTTRIELHDTSASHHPDARPGHFVCLQVTDTGCGMDPTVLKRIFEPFFTTKGIGKGTGLGLATVYGIVKQHRGWVEVESAPGQGTTFRVYWPCATNPDPSATATPEAIRPAGGTETILLVEDEASVRAVTGSFLRRQGYRVLEAADGQAALQQWEQHQNEIQLLFTDMLMPGGLTGKDLAALLLKKRPGLKIIITSGYSAMDLNQNEMAEQNIQFVPKPCEPDRLKVMVRECLDQRINRP
jgi:PAS domain S-box-containing protein